MKKKLIPFTKSSRFVKFNRERDAGLERVLAKYSVAISGIIDTLRTAAQEVAAHMLITKAHDAMIKRNREAYEHRLRQLFEMASKTTAELAIKLRHTTFAISTISQAYAIARALNSPVRGKRIDIGAHKNKEMTLGGSVQARIDLAYTRLLADVVDAYQMSLVMGSTQEETLARIDRAFPKSTTTKKAKRVMARMTEAKRFTPDDDEYVDPEINNEDFFTAQEWNAAVEDYLSEELPFDRGNIFYQATTNDEGEETYTRYSWQVEQEITDDFVSSVRDGESEAANAQGINDFSWIAVIDSKTDTCCSVRDGLTTTEIEEKLDSGEIDGDECEESSAPAHMNCRCRMAPMTEDMPEESGPDWDAFDKWLTST